MPELGIHFRISERGVPHTTFASELRCPHHRRRRHPSWPKPVIYRIKQRDTASSFVVPFAPNSYPWTQKNAGDERPTALIH